MWIWTSVPPFTIESLITKTSNEGPFFLLSSLDDLNEQAYNFLSNSYSSPSLILDVFQSNGPNCVRFLVFYSKKYLASRQEFGFPFLMHPNYLKRPNSWCQKCCHVGTLKAFHLWSLAINVKVQMSTSRSPPIILLDFLYLLHCWISFTSESTGQVWRPP